MNNIKIKIFSANTKIKEHICYLRITDTNLTESVRVIDSLIQCGYRIAASDKIALNELKKNILLKEQAF